MAKKKTMKERVMEQVGKFLPKGMVPDSYFEYIVTDCESMADSEAELAGNVKMQLFEESGVDMPMTRQETEAYLLEELDEEQWAGLNQEGQVLTSQVKLLEDSFDKTMLEMIRELPLIPASRIISSIVISYLRSHGQEISDERAEEITEDLIHSLNTSVSEMVDDMDTEDMGEDSDWDDGPEIEFDWGEDAPPFQDGEDGAEGDSGRSRRRSRITKFPGRK